MGNEDRKRGRAVARRAKEAGSGTGAGDSAGAGCRVDA